MQELKCEVEVTHFISAILESPEVIIGIPGVFALIVIKDGV